MRKIMNALELYLHFTAFLFEFPVINKGDFSVVAEKLLSDCYR